MVRRPGNEGGALHFPKCVAPNSPGCAAPSHPHLVSLNSTLRVESCEWSAGPETKEVHCTFPSALHLIPSGCAAPPPSAPDFTQPGPTPPKSPDTRRAHQAAGATHRLQNYWTPRIHVYSRHSPHSGHDCIFDICLQFGQLGYPKMKGRTGIKGKRSSVPTVTVVEAISTSRLNPEA